MKKFLTVLCVLMLVFVACFATACGDKTDKPTVTIYTSTEDYNMAYMQECLDAQFPDYKIVIEYLGTSSIAAKVLEEKESSDVDIIYAEDYGYMQKLIEAGALDSIAGDYDLTAYVDDAVPATTRDYVLPAIRTGGAVVINKTILAEHNLTVPTSYDDLLDPAYKNLVSMASPKASGTGYMFYYSLVKARGEEAALAYFDALTENILAYTGSGSGPINALVSVGGKPAEVAVGFGMISQAVNKINEGNTDLEILFFEEGAPYNLYGNAIVKGKKARPEAKAVMDYLDSFYTNASNKLYYPEPVLKNKNYSIENFPSDIPYADMEGNNLTNKEALLAKWTH